MSGSRVGEFVQCLVPFMKKDYFSEISMAIFGLLCCCASWRMVRERGLRFGSGGFLIGEGRRLQLGVRREGWIRQRGSRWGPLLQPNVLRKV